MSDITERAAALAELIKGLKTDPEKPEGRILGQVAELLSSICEEVEALRHDHEELDEYVTSIDEDLSMLEDTLLEDDEDYEDEEGCDGDCEVCARRDSCDAEDEDDDDGTVVYACPHCGNEMTFNVEEFDFDEDYMCPHCHQPLFPEGEIEDDDADEDSDEDKDE